MGDRATTLPLCMVIRISTGNTPRMSTVQEPGKSNKNILRPVAASGSSQPNFEDRMTDGLSNDKLPPASQLPNEPFENICHRASTCVITGAAVKKEHVVRTVASRIESMHGDITADDVAGDIFTVAHLITTELHEIYDSVC